MKLKGKDLFFVNETIIDYKNFINEQIRLKKENEEKLKKETPESLNLLGKEADKYPKKF